MSIAHGPQMVHFEVAAVRSTGSGAFGNCNAVFDAGIPDGVIFASFDAARAKAAA